MSDPACPSAPPASHPLQSTSLHRAGGTGKGGRPLKAAAVTGVAGARRVCARARPPAASPQPPAPGIMRLRFLGRAGSPASLCHPSPFAFPPRLLKLLGRNLRKITSKLNFKLQVGCFLLLAPEEVHRQVHGHPGRGARLAALRPWAARGPCSPSELIEPEIPGDGPSWGRRPVVLRLPRACSPWVLRDTAARRPWGRRGGRTKAVSAGASLGPCRLRPHPAERIVTGGVAHCRLTLGSVSVIRLLSNYKRNPYVPFIGN